MSNADPLEYVIKVLKMIIGFLNQGDIKTLQ